MMRTSGELAAVGRADEPHHLVGVGPDLPGGGAGPPSGPRVGVGRVVEEHFAAGHQLASSWSSRPFPVGQATRKASWAWRSGRSGRQMGQRRRSPARSAASWSRLRPSSCPQSGQEQSTSCAAGAGRRTGRSGASGSPAGSGRIRAASGPPPVVVRDAGTGRSAPASLPLGARTVPLYVKTAASMVGLWASPAV
jgi:hypothetical protein